MGEVYTVIPLLILFETWMIIWAIGANEYEEYEDIGHGVGCILYNSQLLLPGE